MKKSNVDSKWHLKVFISIGLVVFLAGLSMRFLTTETVIGTVLKKEVKKVESASSGGKYDIYLIYTSNGIFEDGVSFLDGRFSKGELSKRLKVDICYEMKVHKNLSFTVNHPHKEIISAREVVCDSPPNG